MNPSPLWRLAQTIRDAGIPLHGVRPLVRGTAAGPGNVQVDFQDEATVTQRAQASSIVAAFDWSSTAQATATTEQQRADAKTLYDALDRLGKLARARDLVLLKEINLLRQWLMAFKAQAAAATSLVNFQARVAGLPNLPDRTATQVRAAIRNELDSGAADQPPA